MDSSNQKLQQVTWNLKINPTEENVNRITTQEILNNQNHRLRLELNIYYIVTDL